MGGAVRVFSLHPVMEDKQRCPECGAELHRQPYVMSLRRDRPLLPPWWGLVLIAALVVLALLAATIRP